MTLQQLRFLIAVAESGSINAAAQRLYTAQSNISNAVKSLEQELHIEIFTRSSRGVALTNDGTELLGYARQVVEQADMLEARYEDGGTPQARLAISAQHYAFSVEAFVNVVERCRDSKFEFIMRETTTEEPFSYIPCDRNIRISDRGTLTNLLITSNGYTLSTGVLSNEMQWGMASIPLADAPTMHVGYIMHDERKPSPLLQQYLDELNRIIHAN